MLRLYQHGGREISTLRLCKHIVLVVKKVVKKVAGKEVAIEVGMER
jgi:hypothetical protein